MRLGLANEELDGRPHPAGLPGHDPLTGLPDRRLFERRVERALGRAHQREDYVFAVFFMDLDGFNAAFATDPQTNMGDFFHYHTDYDDFLRAVHRELIRRHEGGK